MSPKCLIKITWKGGLHTRSSIVFNVIDVVNLVTVLMGAIVNSPRRSQELMLLRSKWFEFQKGLTLKEPSKCGYQTFFFF